MNTRGLITKRRMWREFFLKLCVAIVGFYGSKQHRYYLFSIQWLFKPVHTLYICIFNMQT